MPTAIFTHPQLGSLTIENGINNAGWAYGLNTASFPTFGGEVVQILSVYIDNVTLSGTLSTYEQLEAIYGYFGNYLQISTQGKTGSVSSDTTTGTSFNRQPVTFTYPHRNWTFDIYPQNVPGFQLGREVIAPQWQLNAFVIDDSQDLDLIKDGIKALATGNLVDDGTGSLNTFNITGQISPHSGNPDTDPFQTYTGSIAQQTQMINKYADYYNSLIPAYNNQDFAALTGAIGSQPNFGKKKPGGNSPTVTVPTPKK